MPLAKSKSLDPMANIGFDRRSLPCRSIDKKRDPILTRRHAARSARRFRSGTLTNRSEAGGNHRPAPARSAAPVLRPDPSDEFGGSLMFKDGTVRCVEQDDTVAVWIVLGVVGVTAAAVIAGVIHIGLKLFG